MNQSLKQRDIFQRAIFGVKRPASRSCSTCFLHQSRSKIGSTSPSNKPPWRNEYLWIPRQTSMIRRTLWELFQIGTLLWKLKMINRIQDCSQQAYSNSRRQNLLRSTKSSGGSATSRGSGLNYGCRSGSSWFLMRTTPDVGHFNVKEKFNTIRYRLYS